MKIRSTQKWTLQKKDMETPKGVSMTVPDDSYTIQELLLKHQQGLALGIKKLGFYDVEDDDDFDSTDMNQFQNLEYGERQESVLEKREIIESVKAQKARKQAEKAEKEKQAISKKGEAD